MRTRPEVPDDVRAAHLAALRMIGFHGGSFNHTCDRATCTRAAHWRYYPEANPQLARLLRPSGAYEVYEVAAPDGHPAGQGAFVVLRLSEGPAGRFYRVEALVGGYAEAVRLACMFAVDEMEHARWVAKQTGEVTNG